MDNPQGWRISRETETYSGTEKSRTHYRAASGNPPPSKLMTTTRMRIPPVKMILMIFQPRAHPHRPHRCLLGWDVGYSRAVPSHLRCPWCPISRDCGVFSSICWWVSILEGVHSRQEVMLARLCSRFLPDQAQVAVSAQTWALHEGVFFPHLLYFTILYFPHWFLWFYCFLLFFYFCLLVGIVASCSCLLYLFRIAFCVCGFHCLHFVRAPD